MSLVMAGLVGGGLAAVGSLGGAGLSSALGMYSSKKSAKRQYQYYIQSLLNGPSAQVEGLRKAGLNPLLAAGLGATDASIPVSPVHPDVGNPISTALDGALKATAIAEKKNAIRNADNETESVELDNDIKAQTLRQARAEANVAEDEASARQVQSYVAEVEALATLDALGTSVNRDIIPSPDSPGWNRLTARGVFSDKRYDVLVEKIRNAINWDVKSKSDANFWWRRGIEAIHGINEAGSAYDSYRGSRKIIHKR